MDHIGYSVVFFDTPKATNGYRYLKLIRQYNSIRVVHVGTFRGAF